jgi:hypothetical protein
MAKRRGSDYEKVYGRGFPAGDGEGEEAVP